MTDGNSIMPKNIMNIFACFTLKLKCVNLISTGTSISDPCKHIVILMYQRKWVNSQIVYISKSFICITSEVISQQSETYVVPG